MSEAENRPIQDVLREAAAHMEGVSGATCWERLARALGMDEQSIRRDWGAVSATCLETIADRVDAQGVVTVTAPAPTPQPTQAPLQAQAYNLVRVAVEAYELGRAAR
jgi:hypothetical protein